MIDGGGKKVFKIESISAGWLMGEIGYDIENEYGLDETFLDFTKELDLIAEK